MSPDTESWHLLSSSNSGITCGRSSSGGGGHGDLPPARHKHSAILHDDAMWVYGGMTDLQERADFWRWDTGEIHIHSLTLHLYHAMKAYRK
jgi:hypothetical protein